MTTILISLIIGLGCAPNQFTCITLRRFDEKLRLLKLISIITVIKSNARPQLCIIGSLVPSLVMQQAALRVNMSHFAVAYEEIAGTF